MIKIEHLAYSIGEKAILKDIGLSFEEGKIYGIIGPNGAGKSTLLKHIMRIIEPVRGTISYENIDVRNYKIKDYAKKISFVFQENMRALDFTVYEMLLMGRYTYMDLLGNISKEDEELIERVISDLKLEDLKDRSIRTLSGGEAQKVFIGRALVQNTPVILLDEPTSMLDIHNGIELIQLIKQIKEKHNLTIVMVLHDLNLAFNACDEIVVMEKGRVVTSGNKKSVLQDSRLKEVYQNKIHIIEENDIYYVVPKMT